MLFHGKVIVIMLKYFNPWKIASIFANPFDINFCFIALFILKTVLLKNVVWDYFF